MTDVIVSLPSERHSFFSALAGMFSCLLRSSCAFSCFLIVLSVGLGARPNPLLLPPPGRGRVADPARIAYEIHNMKASTLLEDRKAGSLDLHVRDEMVASHSDDPSTPASFPSSDNDSIYSSSNMICSVPFLRCCKCSFEISRSVYYINVYLLFLFVC